MRNLAILFALLLSIGYSIDYSDINTLICTPPAGFTGVKSPILIEESLCTPYGTFNLDMNDITISTASVDATTGALQVAYTDATLTVNGTTYTSRYFQLRSRAEHVLYSASNKRALEIQIEMVSSAASGSRIAVLSFLVQDIGTTASLQSAGKNIQAITNSNNHRVLEPNAAVSAVTFRFDDLSQRIMNKQQEEVYLNIFTYNGTTTYDCTQAATWFVYASELTTTTPVVQFLQSLIQAGAGVVTADTAGNTWYNSRPYDIAYSGGGSQGAPTVMRLCYTGYFKNYISDNYGLWFGVGTILLFFIITLSLGDKPIRAYDYEEDVWTHHPFVSIAKYGNEIHTRKTRSALVLAMVTVHALFSSVFYRDASDPSKPSNTIVFAIYAMLINWVITFFVGNILRSYYEAKYEFHKTKEEGWDQKAQNRLFGFYFSIFVIVVVGWAFTTWNMGELHPETDEQPSKLWVASLFIGMGMEMIIFYPLVCVLAKGSNFIRRIARSIGFMYDKICHETYLDYIKLD